MPERLQKVLARMGVASRRECEKLIEAGRVRVNSKIVTRLGTTVDPNQDIIQVDGKQISHKEPYRYFILYKPVGYLTTFKTDELKPTLASLLPKLKVRIFPVGRLDFNSEGLVFLTNDGKLAYALQHPKFKVPKTYEVRVHGIPNEKTLSALSRGIKLEEGKTKPARLQFIRKTNKNAWLRITLHEGKKRQVRRMFEIVGHPVSRLKRITLGPLTLRGLKKGEYRALTPEEVIALKKYIEKRKTAPEIISKRGHLNKVEKSKR